MPAVIGHRGAKAVKPENTLSGLRYAIGIGADLVEFDVRETADGAFVLRHDASVDRTTDGSGLLNEMTSDEVRDLDAGMGEPVPTYAEAVELLAAQEIEAYIEIKEPGTEERIVDLARDYEVISKVEFITNNMDVLAQVAEMGAPVGGGLAEITDPLLDRAQSLGYRHVGIHEDDISQERVDLVHEYGIDVTVWPVNDRPTTQQVVELGVDLINSDRPGLVLDELERLSGDEDGRQSQP